jgi:hypothetical protein
MSFHFLLLAATALVLVGCGKQGDLQRPAPLFGEPRAVFPSDLERGAPDEASTEENEREDRRSSTPSPNEETRPRDPSVPLRPAAPVNVPPTAG